MSKLSAHFDSSEFVCSCCGNWDSSEEIIAYYFVKEQDNAL